MSYLSIKGGTNGRKSDGFLGHDDLLRATGDDLINASIAFEHRTHVTLTFPTKVNRSAILQRDYKRAYYNVCAYYASNLRLPRMS